MSSSNLPSLKSSPPTKNIFRQSKKLLTREEIEFITFLYHNFILSHYTKHNKDPVSLEEFINFIYDLNT